VSGLQNMSIQNKLRLIIVASTALALLVACVALVVYDQTSYRAELERNLLSQARMIGNNSTAALEFDHEATGMEVLSALQANPSIVAAHLFNAQGKVFARYPADITPEPGCPVSGRPDGLFYTEDTIHVLYTMSEGDRVLGRICLEASRDDLHGRFWQYLRVVGVVALVTIGVAFLLFSRLHGLVSRPIEDLATTASAVAAGRDYSVRARKHGEDELGHLIDCFNEMLEQIQLRDAELQKARSELEDRVKERTKKLVRANAVLKKHIDERSRLEAQLRQAQKMEAIGQLAGGVAHDFNNILTVILGHTSLLLTGDVVSPETAEPLREIESSAKRAAELTRQLLAFSRRQVMRMTPFDLNQVLGGVSKLLQRLLGEHIYLDLHLMPGLPPVAGDVHMLEQVVMNLCVNARDAMAQGGSLRVTTSVVTLDEKEAKRAVDARAGRFVCLEVRDTGCGMDEKTLQHIFEPFFTTKPLGKGTGLGLATVYGIVRQHEGWVEVSSKVGQGTVFAVYLPAGRGAPEASTATRIWASVHGGTETILVVEDEQPVRDFVAVCLRRYGYNVLVAHNGPHAVQVWGQHRDRIDLLLTDMVMPEGMNGRELAARLLQEKPGLRVIYSSGYNEEVLRNHHDIQEAVNYLPKPYEAAQLIRLVRERLDSRV